MWILLRIAAVITAIAAIVMLVFVLVKVDQWDFGSNSRAGRRSERDVKFAVACAAALPVLAVAGGLDWAARRVRDRPRADRLRAAGFAVTEAGDSGHDDVCVHALQQTGFMGLGAEPLFCGARGQGWSKQVAAQFERDGKRYCVVAVRCDESWPSMSMRRISRLDAGWFQRLIAEEPA